MRSTRCWWPDRGRGAREAESTARIIDSQSVKTIKAGGPRGYDTGKKIKGSRRHIATDTAGYHSMDWVRAE